MLQQQASGWQGLTAMRQRASRLGLGLAIWSGALAALTAAIFSGRSRAVDRGWSRRLGSRKRAGDRLIVVAKPVWVTVESALAALCPGLSTRERSAIVLAPALAGLAGKILKVRLPRGRPGLARLRSEGRESFPSTHTAGLGSLALILARVVRLHGRARMPMALAATLTVAIALDRVHTRVHWPSDVLAGMLLAAAATDAACLGTGLS